MAQINLVPLILPVGGFFMVVVGVAGYRRRRRTFTHGTPVLGSIVSFGPDPRASSETRDGRRPTVLAWAFDAAGGRFGGSVSSFDPSLLGERRVGDAIVVLFDPKNPAVNTLWLE